METNAIQNQVEEAFSLSDTQYIAILEANSQYLSEQVENTESVIQQVDKRLRAIKAYIYLNQPDPLKYIDEQINISLKEIDKLTKPSSLSPEEVF